MQNRPHRMDDRRRGASWILHVKAALGLPNTAPHTLNLVPCMQKMQQKQKGELFHFFQKENYLQQITKVWQKVGTVPRMLVQ